VSALHSPEELLTIGRDAIAAAGRPDAEIYLVHSHKGMARFAIGEVGQHVSIDEPEAQVRVALGAQVGEAATSDLTPGGIAEALRAAAEIAQHSPPRDPFPGFARPGDESNAGVPSPNRWSQRTADTTPEERAHALAPVLARIRDAGLVAAGALQTIATSTAVVTTHGVARGDRSTIASARVWALETAGAGGASGFDSAVDREIEALGLPRLAERAVRDALDAKVTPRSLPAGVYDVVLEPEAVSSLLEWLAAIAFGAVEVEQGSSLLSGRLGEKVTGANVTIAEDPLADHPALAVAPFDREGSSRRRVVCIDAGVAREVLHDRTTAIRASAKTTGSGITGWARGVLPGACAVAMEGGDAASVEELLGRMGQGLHVRRFHYVNGFLEPRRAVMTGLTRDGTFLIEQGKRVASVGNLRFTDSVAEAFSRIEAATRVSRAVGSHYADDTAIRAPALLIRGLTFSSGTPPAERR
jgi:PmbA protein